MEAKKQIQAYARWLLSQALHLLVVHDILAILGISHHHREIIVVDLPFRLRQLLSDNHLLSDDDDGQDDGWQNFWVNPKDDRKDIIDKGSPTIIYYFDDIASDVYYPNGNGYGCGCR